MFMYGKNYKEADVSVITILPFLIFFTFHKVVWLYS